MSKTVLLTNGRLPKALELARSLAGAGCRIIIADPFRWHLSRVSRCVSQSACVRAPASDAHGYLADIMRIVEREHVDLVVPVSEETMYVSALQGRQPGNVPVFGMPQSVLLDLHSKHQFIETCTRLGLGAPQTMSADDPGVRAITEAAKFVVKPVFSCSGRGVRFFEKGAHLDAADITEPSIIQAFVEGELYSTFSIVHRGRVLTTVIYRGAVMSGSVAVCFERVEELPVITRWVETFAGKLTYSGFVSFDFVVDQAGRALAIECNPRVTSGVHFVNPNDLASAILDPGSIETIRFRNGRLSQQFFPCLTETQKSFFSPQFRSNLGYLRTARDVTWSARDPLPLLLMPFTAYQIIARSIAKGQSFGEASTFDISWQDAAAASR